jgi:hypothetical protein
LENGALHIQADVRRIPRLGDCIRTRGGTTAGRLEHAGSNPGAAAGRPDAKSDPERKGKAKKAVDAPADSRTAKPKAN